MEIWYFDHKQQGNSLTKRGYKRRNLDLRVGRGYPLQQGTRVFEADLELTLAEEISRILEPIVCRR